MILSLHAQIGCDNDCDKEVAAHLGIWPEHQLSYIIGLGHITNALKEKGWMTVEGKHFCSLRCAHDYQNAASSH